MEMEMSSSLRNIVKKVQRSFLRIGDVRRYCSNQYQIIDYCNKRDQVILALQKDEGIDYCSWSANLVAKDQLLEQEQVQ